MALAMQRKGLLSFFFFTFFTTRPYYLLAQWITTRGHFVSQGTPGNVWGHF